MRGAAVPACREHDAGSDLCLVLDGLAGSAHLAQTRLHGPHQATPNQIQTGRRDGRKRGARRVLGQVRLRYRICAADHHCSGSDAYRGQCDGGTADICISNQRARLDIDYTKYKDICSRAGHCSDGGTCRAGNGRCTPNNIEGYKIIVVCAFISRGRRAAEGNAA